MAEQQESDEHKFWRSQPMRDGSEGDKAGPVEVKTLDQISREPTKLPDQLVWSIIDIDQADQLTEVYSLLAENYVEDDDNMFRFNYSKEFLLWALKPPGFRQDWHLGIRAKKEGGVGRLVAFISGIPVNMSVYSKSISMVEINFLCVHRKLRTKRLAPCLIKEITRLVNLQDIYQAVYTAGVVLPSPPVARCRYYHRSLNPKKLIEVGFSHLAPRMTMQRTIKLYALPDHPTTPNLRPMTDKDVPQVTKLLNTYLQRCPIHPLMFEHDVAHWLVPRDNVIYSYVVEKDGAIQDLCSFYCLPSTIIGHAKHNELRAAYSFYNVANFTPLQQLMTDALILARNANFDVFNALDLMDNGPVFKELRFGIGDGTLQYYLYNYVCKDVEPSGIGLVML